MISKTAQKSANLPAAYQQMSSDKLQGLAQISQEMKDYATCAKTRKLKPEEYTGGSCSVSNMGMMGVKKFAAIINRPQSSSLAVGAGERRAVVKGNAVVIDQQMSVTLSTDHR